MKGLKRLPEFSRETGIKYETLKGLAIRGIAPFIRIGGGWYATPEDFQAWLQGQKAKSPYFAKNS